MEFDDSIVRDGNTFALKQLKQLEAISSLSAASIAKALLQTWKKEEYMREQQACLMVYLEPIEDTRRLQHLLLQLHQLM